MYNVYNICKLYTHIYIDIIYIQRHKHIQINVQNKTYYFVSTFVHLKLWTILYKGELRGTRDNEKAMAPHSSTLSWEIPWTEEPGRLQYMGSPRVGHDWATWTTEADMTFTFHFHALEKEMATHSSVLAWRIPGMGEPGGLPSLGSHRVGHDWSDLAAAAAAAEIMKVFLFNYSQWK